MARSKNSVKYAVVDAFTDTAFKGNPAAVCLLEEQREEKWLQSLASEFNLSGTCYLTRIASPDSLIPRFQLRWFTPVAEIKLCGHATLAAAHFCFTSGLISGTTIEFSTVSGILTAQKVTADSPHCENGEAEQSFLIELDFPVVPFADCSSDEIRSISKALSDVSVIDVKKTIADDFLVVLPSAKSVTDLKPQFEEIRKCPMGLIITAPGPQGSGYDIFSRHFCPKFGIDEDPVTGSVHCALALYWHKQLGKCDLLAFQASQRSGVVKLHFDEQTSRVKLQGNAVTVMEGCVVV